MSSSCQQNAYFWLNDTREGVRFQISKLDCANTPSSLVSIINVHDAVLWTVTALKQLKKSTVTNCFIEAGLKSPMDKFAVLQQGDEDRELLQVIRQFGLVESTYYLMIDEQLNTENAPVNIEDILQLDQRQ